MGVDAMIFVRTRDGMIPEDVHKVDFSPVDPPEYGPRPKEAQFRVDYGGRMYRPGYERGHWPGIAALLLELLVCENVKSVWYFGDDRENLDELGAPIDVEYINRMNEHFVENGYR